MKSKIIKSHLDLAQIIEGKSVLHLNSLGKDSALTLHWLNTFARPSKIISLYFNYIIGHPLDDAYIEHQKERYPKTEFWDFPNPSDLTNIAGLYQSPIEQLLEINHWDYKQFSLPRVAFELKRAFECDYICVGMSRYESFSRAKFFHKEGILVNDEDIYPIGMWSKKQIYDVIKSEKIKLHPFYKFVPSSPDYPSFYKMRSLFLANKEYRDIVYSYYPLLELDEYRYKMLFEKG